MWIGTVDAPAIGVSIYLRSRDSGEPRVLANSVLNSTDISRTIANISQIYHVDLPSISQIYHVDLRYSTDISRGSSQYFTDISRGSVAWLTRCGMVLVYS